MWFDVTKWCWTKALSMRRQHSKKLDLVASHAPHAPYVSARLLCVGRIPYAFLLSKTYVASWVPSIHSSGDGLPRRLERRHESHPSRFLRSPSGPSTPHMCPE